MSNKITKFFDQIKALSVSLRDKVQSYTEDKNIINGVLSLNVGLIAGLAFVISFLDLKTMQNYINIRSHISELKEISENYELALLKSQVTLTPSQKEISDISKHLKQEKQYIKETGQSIKDENYNEHIENFVQTLEKRLAIREELFTRYKNLDTIYNDYRNIAIAAEKVLYDHPDLQVKMKHIMLDLEGVRLMEKNQNRETILKKIQNLRSDIINSPPLVQDRVSLFSERASDVIKLLRYLDTIRSSMRSDGYTEQLKDLKQITTEKMDSEEFLISLKLFALILIGIALAFFQFLMITWFFTGKSRTERIKAKAVEQIENSKIAVIRAKQYALEAQRGQFKLLKNFCSDFSSIIDNISRLTKTIHSSNSNLSYGANPRLVVYSNTLNASVEALEVWLNNYLNIHIAREEWRETTSEKLDIEKIVDDTFIQSRFYANQKEHDMSIYYNHIPYELYGDSDYIQNIYMNLVYVSLKWSSSGWVKTSVEVKELTTDQQILLKTEGDNSTIHMLKLSMIDYSSDEEFLKRKEIFDHQSVEETTSDNEDRFVSAAFYFSRQIGDLIKAKFSFERSIADENILSVSIPVTCKKVEEEIGVPILQNKSAIIVSPYANVLYTLEQQLKTYGMNVSAISDKYAAIGHIVGTNQSETSFDIVILDHRPPEIDALMLAKVVRENSVSGLLHIIVITTEAHLEELEQQSRAHIDSIILKPIRPSELKEKIEHFIEIQLYGPKDSHEEEHANNGEQPKRLLAIMNEDLSSTLIKLIVTRQNYQIDIATTSTQVMELLDINNYDMILVSNKGTWIIPDTTVKDIRRHHSDNKDSAVILIYDELKKAQHTKMEKAGFDDFIELPLSKNTLIEKLEEWEFPTEKRLSKSLEVQDTEQEISDANQSEDTEASSGNEANNTESSNNSDDENTQNTA